MAHTRTTLPVRRAHLINEYYGASDAAFAMMEQVDYFCMHARKAKANRDWRDERELWDAAAHTLYFAIKHRDYEFKCRKEEYRLYKEHMSDFERKVQKSIMAYCKRRLHRLRTWESDNLRLKGNIVHLDQKIHFEKMKYIDLEEAKAEAVHKIRMNGPQKARVTSFGSGWEGGSGGQAKVRNEAYEIRQMKYSISRCQNVMTQWIKEREDAIRTWASNKEAADAFSEEWRPRDEQARRLLAIFEAQRNSETVPRFDKRQASPLLSEIGDEDAEGDEEDDGLCEQDFEDALAEGERTRLAHNLLSPTPVNGESDAGIGEAAFKYAGMKLNDSLLLGAGPAQGSPNPGNDLQSSLPSPEWIEEGEIGWSTPNANIGSQGAWQAAWSATVPAPAEVKTEDWEYTYAQEG